MISSVHTSGCTAATSKCTNEWVRCSEVAAKNGNGSSTQQRKPAVLVGCVRVCVLYHSASSTRTKAPDPFTFECELSTLLIDNIIYCPCARWICVKSELDVVIGGKRAFLTIFHSIFMAASVRCVCAEIQPTELEGFLSCQIKGEDYYQI